MSTESDRERWDRKYVAGEGPAHFEPQALLTRHRHLLSGGRALDVACGFGGNALYLASLGYSVQGVDVSGFALSRAQAEAQRRGLQIGFVQADLTHWWLPAARYDLIVVFFYLNRTLLPRLAAALRNGGLLFQVNRNWRFLEERPSFDPDYLLQPGELCRMARASRLTVLHYTDGTSDHRYNSQLIARRCH